MGGSAAFARWIAAHSQAPSLPAQTGRQESSFSVASPQQTCASSRHPSNPQVGEQPVQAGQPQGQKLSVLTFMPMLGAGFGLTL
jgi:hypothetical protein